MLVCSFKDRSSHIHMHVWLITTNYWLSMCPAMFWWHVTIVFKTLSTTLALRTPLKGPSVTLQRLYRELELRIGGVHPGHLTHLPMSRKKQWLTSSFHAKVNKRWFRTKTKIYLDLHMVFFCVAAVFQQKIRYGVTTKILTRFCQKVHSQCHAEAFLLYFFPHQLSCAATPPSFCRIIFWQTA